MVFYTNRNVPGGGLLRVGRDLDSELYRFDERVPGSLIYRFNRLYIDRRDRETVLREIEAVANLIVLIQTEHRRTDNARRILNNQVVYVLA